ncbi:MAG: single-stranded DNA-binding protein, partial [Desulfurococcales archaeon]|nr:single-stranded DNA-binding protein [Desulfurococcales archaeon]
MSEFGGYRKHEKVKVMELKPEMNNLDIVVRVIEAGEPKVINTRSGQRTISEALVGDESGRVKLTLWGKAAGELTEGRAVEIKGAWTTTYRGDVQLNIG